MKTGSRRSQYDPEAKRAYYLANRQRIRQVQALRYRGTRENRLEQVKARYRLERESILEQKKVSYWANLDTHRALNQVKHAAGRQRLDNLKGTTCLDCESDFPPCCLEFDHRPGTEKSASVGNLPGQSNKAGV